MLRLIIVLLYCSALVVRAQQPTLMLSGGVASSNDSVVANASFALTYPVATLGPGTVLLGMSSGQLYAVPTRITASSSTHDSLVRTQGSSTITTLQATVGYRVSVKPFSLAAMASVGGANAAYRQYQRGNYLFGNDLDTALYSTIAAPSWAFGVSLRVSVDVFEDWSICGLVGKDWYRSSVVTADNAAYGAHSYTATFSDGAVYGNLGLSYRLPTLSGRGPVVDGDSIGMRRDQWYVNAILCSVHPFTSESYNQFNPGLSVQWRDRSRGATGFLEGGAYQYSERDRAMYAGAGFLVPLGTEWIKAGLFGGLLTLHDGGSVRFIPALSPRLTIDTPWISATALLIPAGESTAVGFFIGIPLK